MGLNEIYFKFKWQITFTLSLVLFEASTGILFPLFIGFAIDDVLNKSFTGLYQLLGLGFIALTMGAGRRFYDSRIYARIYENISVEMLDSQKENSTSTISARLNMLKELIEFFEFSFPELVTNFIGLMGTLIIVFSLSLNIFIGCIINIIVIIIVYLVSSNKTLNYNKEYNNELEKQVDVLESKNKKELRLHIKKFMRWNIKLSDLEMINFSIIWIMMLALLIFAIFNVIENDVVKYGTIFSILMYVFQFMENAMNLPYFYQQWLRLKEITQRFKE